MRQGNGNTNLQMATSGLVILPTYNFLEASPDGVVYDPDGPETIGLFEIKCTNQVP